MFSVQSLSRVRLFVTPRAAACQVSLSITNSWSLLKLHISTCQSSVVSDPVTPWTCQALLSVYGIFQPEYRSKLLFPTPGDLPNPVIKPRISCVSCIGRQILYPVSPTTKIKTCIK